MAEIYFNGRRVDGRRANELRLVHCTFGQSKAADGSVLLQQGNTKVLATVFGPRDARWMAGGGNNHADVQIDTATLRCRLNKPAFAGMGERQRKLRNDRKAHDMALTLQESLESVVMLNLYPGSQIEVCLELLQSDGAELAVAFNAASLALVDAGIGMRDTVVAVSCGLVDQAPLVDLNQFEELSGMPQLTLALLGRNGRIAHATMTSRVMVDRLPLLMGAANSACVALLDVLDALVKTNLTRGINVSHLL